MYVIRVFYETGDSFGREDRETILDYNWQKLETAEENLRRIEAQYRMYERMGRHYHGSASGIRADYGHEPWFADCDNESYAEFVMTHSVKLIMDDGTEFIHSCEWEGYFELLYGASVEEKELSSFTTERY